MSRVDVPCPQCGKLLTIPDRKLLGRKGRCPRCQHTFLLHIPPTGVEFAAASGIEAEQPLPSDVALTETLPVDTGVAPIAPQSARSKQALKPSGLAGLPGAGGLAKPHKTANQTPPTPAFAPSQADDEATELFPAFNADGGAPNSPPTTTRTPGNKRRRRGTGGAIIWLLIMVLILAGGGGFAWWASQQKPSTAKKKRSKTQTTVADDTTDATGDNESDSDVQDDGAEADTAVVNERQPKAATTSSAVKPISLKHVPLGARIVFHLRPAQLWGDTEMADEFRACLGPLIPAIESRIQESCLFPPTELDSVVVALIPKSREAFDFAVVARTLKDFKRSEVLAKIDGELVDNPKPHFVGPQRVFQIPDNRTIASAPKEMVESFLEAAGRPLTASEGLEALLKRSRSDQDFAVIAELEDLRNGSATLVPPNVQPLLMSFVDFFGDDVETIAWSFRLGDDSQQARFVSDLKVRNQTTRSPASLSRDLKKRLTAIPNDLLSHMQETQPTTLGHAKVMGRFPAMLKVIEQSTAETHSTRLVEFSLDLPAIAAPNLAAATMLTWDYSTRQDGRGPGKVPSDTGPQIPIAQRLKKRINVEFKNEFLYKTLEFIGGEIGVSFRTDGPGMQRVGVTQNQRQDMKYDNTPATVILNEMLVTKLKDRELCIWIDEAKNQVVVTSRIVAEEQKRQIFPLSAD